MIGHTRFNSGLGESRQSLERLLLGGGADESQENFAASQRDFSATLAKEKSIASKSESLDEPVRSTDGLGPVNLRNEDVSGPMHLKANHDMTGPSSPTPLNINENLPGRDEEVIHEIEEGSS